MPPHPFLLLFSNCLILDYQNANSDYQNRLCTKAKNYEERYRERLKKTLIEREKTKRERGCEMWGEDYIV